MIKQKHFYCSNKQCTKGHKGGRRHTIENAIRAPVGKFCSNECRYIYAMDKNNQKRLQAKGKAIKQKAANKKSREDKKKSRTRSQWFSMLQFLVNQYVRDIRDKDKGCYTCGTNSPDIEYHAGHWVPQKRSDSRRFVLKNIHKQCNKCNTYLGGMPLEYRQHMIADYGLGYVEWLKADKNHPDLKLQFPTWQDIEAEILKYRKLIREAGLTPCR